MDIDAAAKYDALDAEDGVVLQVLADTDVEGEDQEIEEHEDLKQEEDTEQKSGGQEDAEIQPEAMFVDSKKGARIVQYNGFRYRKTYKTKKTNETKWQCSSQRSCGAFLTLNENDEITSVNEEHHHGPANRIESTDTDQGDIAVVITSRKGKEMLLFRQYTYRKQYDKGIKSRWVCSTLKNCKACVFTKDNNFIVSAFEDHCHDPPKYYLKPDNVLGALREPLVLETD